MYKKPFTTEEIKLILGLWEAGKTISQIAYETNRTTGSISGFLSAERKSGRYTKALGGESHPVSKKREKVDLKVGGVKVGEAPASSVERPKPVGIIANGANRGMPVLEMTPRQMIKKLYDMGYRIENNQLVCYQKVVVKVNDILNES